MRSLVDTDPVRCRDVALHMKAVLGDRERCFIGSLNLDPRSVRINTESGLLIESPELTGELRDLLRGVVEGEDAWRIRFDEKGKLTWTSRGETLSSPPGASAGKRILAWIAGWLPIESQL